MINDTKSKTLEKNNQRKQLEEDTVQLRSDIQKQIELKEEANETFVKLKSQNRDIKIEIESKE